MPRSKWLQAADLIDSRYCVTCCTALFILNKSKDEFVKIFKPWNLSLYTTWWQFPSDLSYEENQLARSLALNLMYEMNRKPRNKRGKK